MTVCQQQGRARKRVREPQMNQFLGWLPCQLARLKKPKIRLMTLNLAGPAKTGTPVVLFGRTVPSRGNKPLCPGVHPLFQTRSPHAIRYATSFLAPFCGLFWGCFCKVTDALFNISLNKVDGLAPVQNILQKFESSN